MLRCLQSTVHIPGGYGSYRIRLNSFRFLSSFIKARPVPAADFPLIPSSRKDASKERTKECETLRGYLSSRPSTKLPPEKLVDLYQSVRARSQLRKLGPGQLSTLISIFGASSLPPDALRISSDYVDGPSSYPYWSYLIKVAEDKKSMGYSLNDGDHYWVMCAWVARFHADVKKNTLGRNTKTLPNASFHYRQIWQKTRFPDMLAPYIGTLLLSRNPEFLNTAIFDLCGILRLHSNISGRSLDLVWDLFLSFSKDLSESMKNEVLLSLWERSAMSHQSVVAGRYLATHMFNSLTKRHERLALGISHLVPTLAAPLFPFFRVPVPLSVNQWAHRQLQDALGPSRSVEVRWANFAFFALYQNARNGHSTPTLEHMSLERHFSDWHVVLTLAMLETVVPGNIPSSQGSEVRTITNALWAKWKRIESDRPIFISRAVTSSFLRLAGRTQDMYILDQCRRYSLDNALWSMDLKHTAVDRTQVEALIGDYVEASIRCHGKVWADLFRVFERYEPSAVPGSHAEVILRQLIARDVLNAHEFYEFCVSHRVPVGAKVITLLGMALAPVRVHAVFPILELDLDPFQREELALAVLESLRVQCYQYLSPALGSMLGRVLYGLLESKTPTSRMKALLRYSFPLLVISGRTLDVIRIVELVNERAPSFINPRILKRLLDLILRHRQFALATRLYRVVQSRMEGSSLDVFRQKLILGLHRGGASALAMSLHSSKPRMARSTVEEMVHRVHFRTTIPNCNLPGRVLTILHRRKIHDIPNIRYALSVLVLSNRPKAANRLFQRSLRHLDASTKSWFKQLFQNRFVRRFSGNVLSILHRRKANDVSSIRSALSILISSKRPVAARRLFRESLPHLDESTQLWFGNLFLHRIVKSFGTRNFQSLKRLFRTRKYLVEEFGFTGDRVTFNIFMEAMLRWGTVDSTKVRMLFDDCIRIGYPVGTHWRRVNNVPFGTISTGERFLAFGMLDLNPNISFERHVRPLYKLFVKAFYLRGDVAAAKTVVGILKNEEAESLATQQHRNRARLEGAYKVQARRR